MALVSTEEAPDERRWSSTTGVSAEPRLAPSHSSQTVRAMASFARSSPSRLAAAPRVPNAARASQRLIACAKHGALG